jgi:hypothetical protein
MAPRDAWDARMQRRPDPVFAKVPAGVGLVNGFHGMPWGFAWFFVAANKVCSSLEKRIVCLLWYI